jgi:hypothetical protein
MSITRSYNKHTGTYYAYETTYVWDESQQKKVQKKRCIGQYDPETDEIIPNGKRGRPRKEDASVKIVTTPVSATDADPNVTLISAITELSERLKNHGIFQGTGVFEFFGDILLRNYCKKFFYTVYLGQC